MRLCKARSGSCGCRAFHALRHSFLTRLARSGVAPAVAKSLARHSTIVRTMDHYTHTLIGDGRAALATHDVHTLTGMCKPGARNLNTYSAAASTTRYLLKCRRTVT